MAAVLRRNLKPAFSRLFGFMSFALSILCLEKKEQPAQLLSMLVALRYKYSM